MLLAGWVVLLVGVIWLLHVLGQGPLASPPLTRPGALAGWVEQRSAPEVAFGGLRLAAVGLAGYLLAASLAGLLAGVAGWARCCAALDVVSPAVVRRLLQGAVGVTAAATVAGPHAAAWAAPGGLPQQDSAVPVMHRLAVSPPSHTQPAQPAQSPPAVQPAQSQPASTSTWVVRPGDNLWSVAAATLAGSWGRTPSDAEVDRYWTALIAANRSRLANSDDPDLIFPGQVFQLPPTPG
jgi:hypothetical protein